jgi:hypothetical protein
MNRMRYLLSRLWSSGGAVWALGGALVGLFILLVLIVVSGVGRGGAAVPVEPTPILTVLALPSPTPSPAPTLTPTPAPTGAPASPADPGAGEGFGVGDLVEVYGTGGDSLRLRASPALNAPINMLGVENEVFQVSQGPVDADGFTWWYLVNLVDQQKNGWAVGSFLRSLNPR